MNELLEQLNSCCGWDCVLKSYDGWRLCLASGSSPEYALPLVAFSGVSYLACPTEFSHPRFRPATDAEREQIERLVPLDVKDFLVAIEAETMAGLDRHVFFVAAESGALLSGA